MKVPGPVQDELDRLVGKGVQVAVKNGSKHVKIFVNGRLAGVTSKNGKPHGDKPYFNILSAIRRLAR